MKTTVICNGSEYTWEGSMESWNKHQELIIKWVDGAKIESRYHPHQGWKSHNTPMFDSPTVEYRIEPRTPIPGEVWYSLNDLKPSIFIGNNKFVEIHTGCIFEVDGIQDMSFVATSVNDYYASKQDDPLTVYNAKILTEQLQMGYHLLAKGGHDTGGYNGAEDCILSAIDDIHLSCLE